MPDDPEDKLLILQLSEDSKKIARLLSSETSVKILKLLNKKSMSAGNLSDELGLHLNTLKYNLDSLLEAGMIRVRHVKWSQKGRKINVYEATEKVIVFLPPKENLDNPLFLRKHGQDSPESSERQEIPKLLWN